MWTAQRSTQTWVPERDYRLDLQQGQGHDLQQGQGHALQRLQGCALIHQGHDLDPPESHIIQRHFFCKHDLEIQGHGLEHQGHQQDPAANQYDITDHSAELVALYNPDLAVNQRGHGYPSNKTSF